MTREGREIVLGHHFVVAGRAELVAHWVNRHRDRRPVSVWYCVEGVSRAPQVVNLPAVSAERTLTVAILKTALLTDPAFLCLATQTRIDRCGGAFDVLLRDHFGRLSGCAANFLLVCT